MQREAQPSLDTCLSARFQSHGCVALSFSGDTDAGGDPLAVEKRNKLFSGFSE